MEKEEPKVEKIKLYAPAAPFIRKHPKIGRNDPCPCGKTDDDNKPVKFKKCCLYRWDNGFKQ